MKMIFALALTLFSAIAAAEVTYLPDGTTAFSNGNSTIYSNGESAHTNGDTTMYSNGISARHSGDMTYYSNGTTGRTMGNGNFQIRSDGTTVQRIGNRILINGQ